MMASIQIQRIRRECIACFASSRVAQYDRKWRTRHLIINNYPGSPLPRDRRSTVIEIVKDWLEALSYLTVIVSLPLALYQYRKITTKEQADREYGTYNALDEKYLEFLEMCYHNPRLDIFDIVDGTPHTLDQLEKKQELVAFTMLFSIFERAFLMYHDQSDRVRTRQWTGWHEYIQQYCKRANFRNAWSISGSTFDSGFQAFMQKEITEAEAATHAARE